MTLKEGFIGSDILDSYNIVGTNFNHFIYQLEWIPVRKQFADAVYIHDRRFIAVVYGSLYFVQTDFFAHLTGKLVVDRMSRTSCNDAAFDGFTDKGKVTDDIE